MSVLETKVKVDETDVSRIKIGDSTVIQIDAFPDTTFVGRVTEISNSSVKAGARRDRRISRPGHRLRGHDPAPERAARDASGFLGDGEDHHRHADRCALDSDHRAHGSRGRALKADTAAHARPSGRRPRRSASATSKACSWSAPDNKVTFRPVKVGIAGEKYFEVLTGLKEGEKIVGGTYQAIRELKDGALVRAQKDDTEKARRAGEDRNAIH